MCSDDLIIIDMHIKTLLVRRQAALANYHSLCGLNNLLLMVLGTRSSRSECQHDQVLFEGPLPGHVFTWTFLGMCMQREISFLFLVLT